MIGHMTSQCLALQIKSVVGGVRIYYYSHMIGHMIYPVPVLIPYSSHMIDHMSYPVPEGENASC